MKMPRTFSAVFVLSLLLAASASAETVGYIDQEKFFPLLELSSGDFSSASSTTIVKGFAINAFEPASSKLPISRSHRYQDAFSDEWWVYGVAPISSTNLSDFYLLGDRHLQSTNATAAPEAVASFYRYFAKDVWGRHFIEKEEWLSLSNEELGERIKVRAHHLTDLDHDGFQELWLTYRLMYGEVGRMIYEQEAGGNWKKIVNHCYSCD